jgi:hypothetical protein
VERKNSLNESVQSTKTVKADKQARNPCLTQSSSVFERKSSSLLFQGYIF